MADETYEEDPLEEEFVEEEEPEPVLTSEQEWVNRKAEALNIDPFDLDVEYAHQAVEDTCASMDEVRRHKRVEEIGGASPEMLRLYQLGIPKLCPKHRAVAQAIGDGTIPLYVGTYEVGRGAGKVAPGTWQLKERR